MVLTSYPFGTSCTVVGSSLLCLSMITTWVSMFHTWARITLMKFPVSDNCIIFYLQFVSSILSIGAIYLQLLKIECYARCERICVETILMWKNLSSYCYHSEVLKLFVLHPILALKVPSVRHSPVWLSFVSTEE